MCQTLQILVGHTSFTNKQMMFLSIFCIVTRQSKIGEKLKICNDKWPPDGKYEWFLAIFTIRGPFVTSNFQFFPNFWVSDRDTENFIKYHLFIYKRSMFDQNLKGLAQKLGLPRASQVQNWNGHGGFNFWATTTKFCENA